MAKHKEETEHTDRIRDVLGKPDPSSGYYGLRTGDEIQHAEKITTGSFLFDRVLGGGYSSGSFCRAFGDFETGKTSMGLCWAKNWQDKYRERARVLFFNAEGRLTRDLVDRSGLKNIYPFFTVIDTNNGDYGYSKIEELIIDNPDDDRYFVIWDSTDAGVREKDLQEKTVADAEKMAGGAALASAAGKRLSLLFNRNHHFLYLTSQVRDVVQQGGGKGPAMPSKQASGGNAPKFYSSLICQFMKPWADDYIYENETEKKGILGRKVRIKLLKTQNERSNELVQYPVKHGAIGGIWKAYEAMMVAQAWDYYKQQKAWFTVTERKAEEMKQDNITFPDKFHGEKEMLRYFEANEPFCLYILDKVKEYY